MKKLIATILVLMLMVTVFLPVTAENEEHYDYVVSYIGASGAEIDDMYHYFCDKFNVDFEMVSYGWGDYATNASMMVNGGTMMDMLTVDTGFDMIANWASQGLIRALPDNWQEAYPNIYTYMKNSGLVELLTQDDGKVYCVPKAIYAHFTAGDIYLNHRTLFYRADWAKQLGYEFGNTITISELAKFAKECVEKDLSGTGTTIGLTLRSDLINELMNLSNPRYGGITKVDGEYVWGPTIEGTAEGIAALKTLYNDGVLDPDFYVNGNGAEMANFTSGRAAVVLYDGLVGSYNGLINDMVNTGTAADKAAALDMTAAAVLVNDEGVWGGAQVSNYCWANIFSPEMSEDKYLRLLDLLDYLYTKEGELIYNLGIENVAWFEQDGSYKLIYYNADGVKATADFNKDLYALVEDGNGSFTAGEKIGSLKDEGNTFKGIGYPSKAFWFRQAILGDDFMLADPAADPTIVERISACYETRYQNAKEFGYTPVDYDYMFYSSPTKSQYSVGVNSEILRLVADINIPVENVAAEWNQFIENNRIIWEPLVNELNEVFAN